jgi:hypothetical protein
MADPETGAGGSVDERLDRLQSELEPLRRELNFTRVAAGGLLLVGLLSLYGASRMIVFSAFSLVGLVVVFLSWRWDIDDHEMSLGPAIALTLGLAGAFVLAMLWAGLL